MFHILYNIILQAHSSKAKLCFTSLMELYPSSVVVLLELSVMAMANSDYTGALQVC